MPRNQRTGVRWVWEPRSTEVARVGDVEYRAPRLCPIPNGAIGLGEEVVEVVEADGKKTKRRVWRAPVEIDGQIQIIDGHPRYVGELTLRILRPLTPREMQRLPWGRLANGAIEANSIRVDRRSGKIDVAAGKDVNTARTKASRATGRSRRGKAVTEKLNRKTRVRVTDERLAEVVALRAEGQARGERRWDVYAADRLHYTPAYCRQLAHRADALGIKPPRKRGSAKR